MKPDSALPQNPITKSELRVRLVRLKSGSLNLKSGILDRGRSLYQISINTSSIEVITVPC